MALLRQMRLRNTVEPTGAPALDVEEGDDDEREPWKQDGGRGRSENKPPMSPRFVCLSLVLSVVSCVFSTVAVFAVIREHSLNRQPTKPRPRGGLDCSVWQQDMTVWTKIHSQGNQDNILAVIFGRIGTTNKFFVEFGLDYVGSFNCSESGMDHAASNAGLNTRLLAKQGWHGMYFDAVVSVPECNITRAVLTEDNIGTHFESQGVPHDVDYVSIDVDSVDLWLLRGLLLTKYRPRVISVEFNSNFPRDTKITFQRSWHEWAGRSVYGSSVGALNFIANEYGYTAVYIMEYMDIFFVRRDLLEQHCDMKSLLTYDELSAHLPLRIHKKCTHEDLTRVLDLSLALEGEEKAANRRAVEIMRGLDMCHVDAFEKLDDMR